MDTLGLVSVCKCARRCILKGNCTEMVVSCLSLKRLDLLSTGLVGGNDGGIITSWNAAPARKQIEFGCVSAPRMVLAT